MFKKLFGIIILSSSLSFGFQIDKDVMFGLKLQTLMQQDGAITNNQSSSTNFSVQNARIYFMGKLNKFISFGTNLDFSDNNLLSPDGSARAHQGMKNTYVKDAYINFRQSKALNLMAGLFMDPYSRASLTDSYYTIIPTMEGIGQINSLIMQKSLNMINGSMFINPFTPLTLGSDISNSYRDLGLSIWGANDFLKYYFTIANGRYDYFISQNHLKPNLKYGVRVEFSPSFLGFNQDPSFMDYDTYFGERKTLTLGISYQMQKIETMTNSNTSKAFDMDILYEEKFKRVIPNVQLGYANISDLPSGMNPSNYNPSFIDSNGYYAQLSAIYDKFVGIGKPSLAIRYEKDNNSLKDRVSLERYSLFFNYYIDKENAKISIGLDDVVPNAALINYTRNNNTFLKSFIDYSVYTQIMF